MHNTTSGALELSTRARSMSQMKGIAFANVRNYVLQKHGERWGEVVARMSASDVQVVESAVAVGWYDVELFGRLLRAVDQSCGRGDLALLSQIGEFEAEQDFHRVLRVFLRILTPAQLFAAEARLWRHFQNSGEWSTNAVPNGADATLKGWAVDGALCRELGGYLKRLLQFAGGKDVRVGHGECRGQGATRCVFQLRWR